MSDIRPVWTPPVEPDVLEARLRKALQHYWPTLLAGVDPQKAAGREAQIFDVPGSPPMRIRIGLRGTEVTQFRQQRTAIRAEFVGLAVQEQQVWDVQAVAMIDRDTRAMLDLRLKATINLRRP